MIACFLIANFFCNAAECICFLPIPDISGIFFIPKLCMLSQHVITITIIIIMHFIFMVPTSHSSPAVS